MRNTLKYILTVLLLMTSMGLAQRKYYTFSELRGMENQVGNTHLFYKISYTNSSFSQYEDIIYHFDLQNNVDTVFLSDEGINSIILGMYSTQIEDYEFWDNNPAKYIYIEEDVEVDPSVLIRRFDKSAPLYNKLGEVINGNLEISGQDDSLIFAYFGGTIMKSTDGGYSWGRNSSWWGKQLVSLNPYNDSIFFTQDYTGLYKTTDRGESFSLVDTFQTDYKQFLYDKDKNHIYRIAKSGSENFLSVSNNKGNAFSWTRMFSDVNKLFISLDDSTSGSIYLADRNYIYHSVNYGNSFVVFKKLAHDIVGIYEKPNSNKLYVATKYKLLEIDGDSIKTLKSLPIDPEIFSYYPLGIGNKWIYENTYVYLEYGVLFAGRDTLIREVAGDTMISNNKYYIIKDRYLLQKFRYTNYERVDSTTGQIFVYDSNGSSVNDENLLFDLISEVGDTNSFMLPFENSAYPVIYLKDTATDKWGSNKPGKIFETTYNNINYTLTDSIGIDRFDDPYGSDNPGSEYTLVGCIINGKVYGDTTITVINDQKNIPTKFNLSQNYPNPFNPTTTIKYSIPSLVDANLASTVKVQLKVYDILGRLVATLVNKEQRPGNYKVQFNASNLASGIYFYRLKYGSFIQTKKMILLK